MENSVRRCMRIFNLRSILGGRDAKKLLKSYSDFHSELLDACSLSLLI